MPKVTEIPLIRPTPRLAAPQPQMGAVAVPRKSTNAGRVRRFDPDSFTYLHEEEIRAAIKRHASHCTFSIDRMDEQRKKFSRLLQRRGLAVPTAIHRNFSSLDNDRRSLACPYERFRTRAWALGVLMPILLQRGDTAYSVTVADVRWRVPVGELTDSSFDPVIRKIRAGAARLRSLAHSVAGMAVIEVCANRDVDGDVFWEPHFHMAVVGAPREAIREAFGVRLPKELRGRVKPLQAKEIRPGELGSVLCYITKVKPELRSAYRRENGRVGRRRNHLPKQLLPDWLAVMAARPASEMIVHIGLGPSIARQFRTAEMSFILGELL